MRTIELREYQPTPTRLTRSEVRQLRQTGLVEIQPLYAEDEYELRAGSSVGTVVLPTLQLLIRPKVDIRNVLFLLGYGTELATWAQEQFPYEEEPDLLRAVARIFEAEVSRSARQGLIRGYQAKRETLTTLRGRIDVARQFRLRQGRPFPLECSFEEYTEDVRLNRVVKAAIRRLLQVPGLSPGVARMLRFRYRLFDEVASVEYAPGSVPDIGYTRLHEHWRPAGELARIILNQDSLRDEIGKTMGIAFTVDMNELFERFVEKIVDREARRAGLCLVPQARRQLSTSVYMKPDLVLQRGGSDLAVGDAKYKDPSDGGLRNEDLYQLLAYCVALGLERGLLIYAGELDEWYHVERAGIVLEATAIDLTGGPEQIEASARRAASRLVEHANEEHRRRGTARTTPLAG